MGETKLTVAGFPVVVTDAVPRNVALICRDDGFAVYPTASGLAAVHHYTELARISDLRGGT
jgi:hypothetical protein